MNAKARFWDGIAEKYAATPVADIAAFERKKAITRDLLRPDATVLEIGCGTGTLALEMARFAGHVHAMDISGEMVRIANQKKSAQRVANVTFHQGTLDEPAPFAAGTFDVAWAYSILHLVDDRRRTLATLFELLKPGGVFVSSNLCMNESWVPYGSVITVMRWFGKAPVVYRFDRETILREIREAGFDPVEVRDVGANKMIAFVVARKPA